MLISNIQFPIETYGGKTALMETLTELSTPANIPVVKYSGISEMKIREIIESVFYRSIEEIDHNIGLTESRLISLHELIKDEATTTINDYGFPVLKTSFLANNNPSKLSFAGVGCTAIPRDKTAPLGVCIRKILFDRKKEYANNYRKVHEGINDDSFGCMLMEYLPKQLAWGTVWSSPNGSVFEIFTTAESVQVLHFLVRCKADLMHCTPSSIINKKLFRRHLQELYEWVSSIPYSDIEFCVSENNVLLTQYRPIPQDLVELLHNRENKLESGRCPPPYSSVQQIEGTINRLFELKKSQSLYPVELTDIKEAQKNNQIWFVSYFPQNVQSGLLQLLMKVSKYKNIKLPTIVAVVDEDRQWGHLHAVAAEDPNIDTLVYMKLTDYIELERYEDGVELTLSINKTGWAVLKQ